MILYLFVVFLLLFQGVFADKPENYTVRNTHWGMTPEEVKQEEDKKKKSWKKIKDEDRLICYKGTWDDIEGKVCYNFLYKALISLEYEIQGDSKRFHIIFNRLKEKYNITSDSAWIVNAMQSPEPKNKDKGSFWLIHEGQTRLSLSLYEKKDQPGIVKILYESTDKEYEKVDGIIDDL